MGMYDTLTGVPENYDATVKCWDCTMAEFKVGDAVPAVGIAQAYSIQLGAEPTISPRFVIIEALKILTVGAPDPATGTPVFDKWGKYIGHGGKHLARPENPMTKALDQAIMGQAWTVQKSEAKPSPVATPKGTPSELHAHAVTHQLRLRDNYGVKLKLPKDLTEEEADRLASWIRALPISRSGV
jgi:hypothetical protein